MSNVSLDKSIYSNSSVIQTSSNYMKSFKPPNNYSSLWSIWRVDNSSTIQSNAKSKSLFIKVVTFTFRVSEDEACTIFHQIVSGIEYIHKLNIVHRDLKPQNLLIDYDRSIRLVDFGLSNTYRKGIFWFSKMRD